MLKDLPSPRSAWLLIGDRGSFYSEATLRRIARGDLSGRPRCWTCSPRVEVGDILLIYFVAPRSAVHMICRAKSRPYVDRNILPEADRAVSRFQWWVDITPPMAIEPIPYDRLEEAAGGYLNLKGRSGHFLDPDVANRVLHDVRFRFAPSRALADGTLKRVVGRSELPDPESLTLRGWREIPSAALRVEKEVERYVVEPLLRFCGFRPGDGRLRRQFRLPGGVADYVVADGDAARAVIEVKQRVASPRSRDGWRLCEDYLQICAYGEHLRCNALLMDCDQIFLFSGRGMRFAGRFDRRALDRSDVESIRRHLLGSARGQKPSKPTADGPPRSPGAADESSMLKPQPLSRSKTIRGVPVTFQEMGRRTAATVQRGTVTIRPSEIAIELMPDEDFGRYRVSARRFPNGSYAGKGGNDDGAAVRVHFAELGRGDFVGRWIEDGYIYWFTFACDRRKHLEDVAAPSTGKAADDELDEDEVPLSPRDVEAREKRTREEAARRRAGSAMAVHGEPTKR